MPAKYVRLTQITYPNGREVNYDYSGAIDDVMSRLSAIFDDADNDDVLDEGEDVYASYSYLGAGRVVTESYEDIEVKLDYNADENLGGLDRFGRVVDQVWQDYSGESDVTIDEYRYGYDLAGNLVWKENVVAGELQTPVDLDELYEYDAGYRLVGAERGDLVDGQDGKEIDGTPEFTQDWGLDVLGNWSEFDDDGTSQTREANEANEITDITGGDWITPDYDDAGNMIYGPRPGAETMGQHYVYDAWNRLVGVYEDDGDGEFEPGTNDEQLAANRYDGANRRIEQLTDFVEGTAQTATHYFLNNQNQVLETREGSPTTAPESLSPKYQNIWSPRYIDSLILRDQYSGGVIQPASRLFYLADANYNVTALVGKVSETWQVVERYVYDAYGKATVLDPNFTPDADGLSDFANATLYTGRELDLATGLFYYRARYYDAALGRLISRDPMGYQAGDMNLYQYVAGNPLLLLDPTGAWWGGWWLSWIISNIPIANIIQSLLQDLPGGEVGDYAGCAPPWSCHADEHAAQAVECMKCIDLKASAFSTQAALGTAGSFISQSLISLLAGWYGGPIGIIYAIINELTGIISDLITADRIASEIRPAAAAAQTAYCTPP